MKQLIAIIAIILFPLAGFAQQDKDVATEKYKVEGNCNMCKKRIENAAYVKGVKRAEWNKETHELTLVYKTSKTTAETILSAVAKAGHNSDLAKSDETDYKELPECCQYKTHNHTH